VAVTWAEVRTAHLVPVYWFAGYVWSGQSAAFELIRHPTQGGWFADDDVPANLDPIAGYGRLGFFRDGYLPCPDPQPGACCLEDGTCLFTSEEECDGLIGSWLEESSCEPNPCTPVLTIESSWGKLKSLFRETKR
jgi:hypothetical protein